MKPDQNVTLDPILQGPMEPVLNKEVLKLHILYLEKLDYLSKLERQVYEKYLTYLANPITY